MSNLSFGFPSLQPCHTEEGTARAFFCGLKKLPNSGVATGLYNCLYQQ